MKITAAVAACCALATTAAFAGPFDQFKGKMKPGMYEYKMEMDMGQVPGMPPGMGKQSMTFQKCLTQKDIDDGGFGKNQERAKRTESCDIQDMKMSGNSASYRMVCKEPKMTADNHITFKNDGFSMDMKMAMEQRGQMMNMTQHMDGRYLGACK